MGGIHCRSCSPRRPAVPVPKPAVEGQDHGGHHEFPGVHRLCPACHMMVKLKNGTRTCSCAMQAMEQSLGPDYQAVVLHLLDIQGEPVVQIDYIRGLENHPLRGTKRDIQRAINLIRRMNTRGPPDRMSSSDEDVHLADDEEPCQGFSTSPPTEPEKFEIAEEDRPEYNRILAIIQGRLPPERPPRRQSSTRDDLLDRDMATPGTSTQNQAGAPTHARRGTRTPPRWTSSEEDSPLRIQLRSQRTLMKGPRKKKKPRSTP